MKLASVWTSIVQVFNVLTFSSPEGSDVAQHPITLNDGGSGPHNPPPKIPITQDESGQFFRGKTPMVQEYSSGMVYHPEDHEFVPLRTGGKEFSFMYKDHPVVGTPKNPQEGPGGGLNCHYPDMTGWESCHSPTNRSCWLKKGGEYIDINTDYENPAAVPKGKTRYFNLEVSEQPISPDGETMEHGKVFNRRYPGPWIGGLPFQQEATC